MTVASSQRCAIPVERPTRLSLAASAGRAITSLMAHLPTITRNTTWVRPHIAFSFSLSEERPPTRPPGGPDREPYSQGM